MRQFFLSIVLVMLSGPPGFARALPDVLPLLQGYEWQLSQETFTSVDGDVVSALMEVVRDDQQLPFLRERALVALSLYPGDAVEQLLLAMLQSSENEHLRRQAVDITCRTFREVQRLKAALLPLLDEADAHLRIRTARCLVTLDQGDDPEIRRAFAAYRQRIQSPWERGAAGLTEH